MRGTLDNVHIVDSLVAGQDLLLGLLLVGIQGIKLLMRLQIQWQVLMLLREL